MKSKAKILMIFVSGLLVGALATFIILGKRSEWVYADCYTTSVMDKAFEATELRAHRQDELGKKIEALLPGAVLAIHQHKEFQNAPYGRTALRTVKHFYEVNSLPIPSEISDILNSLPSDH